MDDEMVAVGGLNRSTRRKSSPVPIFELQIRPGLNWIPTRIRREGTQWLTTLNMTRHGLQCYCDVSRLTFFRTFIYFSCILLRFLHCHFRVLQWHIPTCPRLIFVVHWPWMVISRWWYNPFRGAAHIDNVPGHLPVPQSKSNLSYVSRPVRPDGQASIWNPRPNLFQGIKIPPKKMTLGS
jgi:hypothetical protein